MTVASAGFRMNFAEINCEISDVSDIRNKANVIYNVILYIYFITRYTYHTFTHVIFSELHCIASALYF